MVRALLNRALTTQGTICVRRWRRPSVLAVYCVPKSRIAGALRTEAPTASACASLPMQGGPSRLCTFQAIPVNGAFLKQKTHLLMLGSSCWKCLTPNAYQAFLLPANLFCRFLQVTHMAYILITICGRAR